jgi:hypothetical protein
VPVLNGLCTGENIFDEHVRGCVCPCKGYVDEHVRPCNGRLTVNNDDDVNVNVNVKTNLYSAI